MIGILFFLTQLVYFPVKSIETNEDNIIYVDDDNINGPWDGTQEHPFKNIQDGINQTSNDVTVFVHNGFYQENLIVENRSIILLGENQKKTIIDGNRVGDALRIIENENFTISCFTIQNAKRAIFMMHTNNTTVSNNIIKNNVEMGIWLVGSHGNNFIKNEVVGNDNSGIYFHVSRNNVILENNVTNNGLGVWLAQWCNHNRIFNNNIKENKCGILISVLTPFTHKENESIQKVGISLDSEDTDIKGNNVFNNEYGIYLNGAPNTNVTANNISGNSINGIWCRAAPVLITGNNFIENPLGHAYFKCHFLTSVHVSWNSNYWDDWNTYLPRPIFGEAFPLWFENFSVPWVNFDWNPSQKIYSIY